MEVEEKVSPADAWLTGMEQLSVGWLVVYSAEGYPSKGNGATIIVSGNKKKAPHAGVGAKVRGTQPHARFPFCADPHH